MTKTSHSIFCLVLIIISTSLITWFLPRQQSFSYDYTVGKPWRYGQIIAEYDFPIYKSDNLIKAERDSVRDFFQPYFSMNTQEGEIQVRHFKESLSKGKITGLSAAYIDYITKSLRIVYNDGIISNEDFTALVDSGIQSIHITQGTLAQAKEVKELRTIRDAYLTIMEGDTLSFKREILAGIGLQEYLVPNLQKDMVRSKEAFTDLLSSISYASGMVQSGQKVIDRGDIVTPLTVSILDSMQRESAKRHDSANQKRMMAVGQFLLILIVLTIYFIYLRLFRKDYVQSSRTLTLPFFLLTIFPIATAIVEYDTPQSAYLIPYAMIPIFIRVFMDARTAATTMIASILLCSLCVRGPFEFILVQSVAGMVAIYSVKELSSRSQMFRVSFQVTLAALAVMLTYDLSQGITLTTVDPLWYISLFINCVLLLFTYPVMYAIERIFNFTSSVTLIELSNVNMPLLRKMSKEAQGTFNHSMQVANLAAEVAARINGKVELVRTGALYHDIGKMKNPAFFTENQSGINPHESLTEEKSAQIIIQHVTDGLEIADSYHLPKVIKSFIASHHGRSMAKYFYINYVNAHPGEGVNEALFTYPGPNPKTKEEAILMMADSIEAASRSLKAINEESLTKLVNDIVNKQMQEGYFSECPITFSDIETAKEQFISSLKTAYHTRISYPTLKEQSGEQPEENRRGSNIFSSWNHTKKQR